MMQSGLGLGLALGSFRVRVRIRVRVRVRVHVRTDVRVTMEARDIIVIGPSTGRECVVMSSIMCSHVQYHV